MKHHFLILLFLFVICCKDAKTQEPNLFEVSKHHVGLVTDSTLVKDLKKIFENDSIINFQEDDSFVGGLNPIDIYEKNGNPLLSIFPTDALDSTAGIDYVKLIDKRYKTTDQIGNQSYFLDIKKAYRISEIKNELNVIKLQIHQINATFLIQKKKLERNFDIGIKIDSTQIPDSTKIDGFIKHF